jgi:sortase A
VAGIDAYRVIDPLAPAREHALQQQLEKQWRSAPAAAPVLRVRTGRPFAMLRIPALGRDWKFAVIEGASLAQLATGPGHVTGTALPGQAGNFAVAAHDITAGNPFLHLASLRPGDAIYVTTRYGSYKYLVTGQKIVRYTDVAVLAPVPGQPGLAPGKPYVTLITCTPVTLAFTPWRLVVTGVLTVRLRTMTQGTGLWGPVSRGDAWMAARLAGRAGGSCWSMTIWRSAPTWRACCGRTAGSRSRTSSTRTPPCAAWKPSHGTC